MFSSTSHCYLRPSPPKHSRQYFAASFNAFVSIALATHPLLLLLLRQLLVLRAEERCCGVNLRNFSPACGLTTIHDDRTTATKKKKQQHLAQVETTRFQSPPSLDALPAVCGTVNLISTTLISVIRYAPDSHLVSCHLTPPPPPTILLALPQLPTFAFCWPH